MIVDELILVRPDGVLRLEFHHRLTVLAGLDAAQRDRFVGSLHRAICGAEAGSELRYTDDSGKRYVIRRSSGRRRIAIEDRAAARALGDMSVPRAEDLPRLTHITADDLAGSSGVLPSVPQLVERLIGWLGRARHAGSRGRPSLAVLSEPLVGLDLPQTRALLDALDRLGQTVQIVYLTGDPVVAAWARERETTDTLSLVDGTLLPV